MSSFQNNNSVSPIQGKHIVVLGNPGAGKSTLLNCLAGRPVFRSGVSLGTGLTTVLQTETVNKVTYSDTPGLEDVETRAKAAKEIQKVLRRGGFLTILFIMTLESGRVRPSDMAIKDVILNAIRRVKVDPNFRYSIIVNKCEPGTIKLLQEDVEGRIKLEGVLGVAREFNHIAYMPLILEAQGAENAYIGEKGGLVDFVSRAPVMALPPNSVLNVIYVGYGDIVERLREMLENLRRKIEETIEERRKKKTGLRLLRKFGSTANEVGSQVSRLFEEGYDAIFLSR